MAGLLVNDFSLERANDQSKSSPEQDQAIRSTLSVRMNLKG